MERNEGDKYYIKNKEVIEARTRYSLVTMKFFAGIIYKITAKWIKPTEENSRNVYYSIDLNEIKELTGINYEIEYIEERVRRIREELKTPITIKKVDGTVIFTDLFKEFRIKSKKVEVEISKEVLPLIIEKSRKYLKLGFTYISLLSSEYAVKLYENILLRADKSSESRQTVRFELWELEFLLNHNYKNWINIKQKIVDESIKQFTENKLFREISYNTIYDTNSYGRGRKPVVAVEFVFIISEEVYNLYKTVGEEKIDMMIDEELNNKLMIGEVDYEQEQRDLSILYSEVREGYLTERVKFLIQGFYRSKGYEYVKSNIDYANKRGKENYVAYLEGALNENWGKLEVVQEGNEIIRLDEKKKSEMLEDRRYKKEQKEIKKWQKMFDSLPDSEKAKVIKAKDFLGTPDWLQFKMMYEAGKIKKD